MNVSIQDTYNLVWKLGAVLTEGADPAILETYDSERRSVAKKLMDLDARLVGAYETQQNGESSGVYEVRERYSAFMSGVGVTYSPSVLIAFGETHGNPALARDINLGMRLPSNTVTYQRDGASIHLAQWLTSDGSWKLLVFAADLGQPKKIEALVKLADYFTDKSLLRLRQKKDVKSRGPMIDLLLIHTSVKNTNTLSDLPEIFHPFNEVLDWDDWKVFADVNGQAYEGYGIEANGDGCLVLCRPDQHVAWIGGLEDMSGVNDYFSFFP
jgi:phenol 2-monooxygenase